MDKRKGMPVKKKGVRPTVIGERIYAFRIREKLTQADFAELCGISKDVVFRIEAGKTNPRKWVIEKLSAGMGINPPELTGPSLAKRNEMMVSTEPGAPKAVYPLPSEALQKKYEDRLAIERFKKEMTIADLPERFRKEADLSAVEVVIKMISKLSTKFYALSVGDREDVIGFIDYKLTKTGGTK